MQCYSLTGSIPQGRARAGSLWTVTALLARTMCHTSKQASTCACLIKTPESRLHAFCTVKHTNNSPYSPELANDTNATPCMQMINARQHKQHHQGSHSQCAEASEQLASRFCPGSHTVTVHSQNVVSFKIPQILPLLLLPLKTSR